MSPSRSFASAGFFSFWILAGSLSLVFPSHANMLVNPGFETGDLSGWSISGNSPQVGVATDGTAVLPSPHEPFETSRQNVRTGQYAGNAIIRGTPIERAVLSQTISVIPNTIYDIGFWLGIDASSGFGMDINDSRTQIFVDGLGLLPSSFLSIPNGSGPEDFVEIGGSFDSGARTSITVDFAINGSGIAEAGASFDDFYVSVPVPEATTAWLLLPGLLAVWGMRGRSPLVGSSSAGR